MKVLQIESHPDYNNLERTINKLADKGYKTLIESGVNSEDITRVNLYAPQEHSLTVTQATLTGQESQELMAYREELQTQLIEAEQIYIYMPLHNFNITSALKDYVDTVLIANKTFKYTENGPVGLLSDDKKVTFIMSSGSEFTKDYSDKSMDHAPRIIESSFKMMGINNVTILRAEGLDIITNDKEAIIEKTMGDLVNHIKSQNK